MGKRNKHIIEKDYHVDMRKKLLHKLRVLVVSKSIWRECVSLFSVYDENRLKQNVNFHEIALINFTYKNRNFKSIIEKKIDQLLLPIHVMAFDISPIIP